MADSGFIGTSGRGGHWRTSSPPIANDCWHTVAPLAFPRRVSSSSHSRTPAPVSAATPGTGTSEVQSCLLPRSATEFPSSDRGSLWRGAQNQRFDFQRLGAKGNQLAAEPLAKSWPPPEAQIG